MEELFRDNLENGEQLLWTGRSGSAKVFDKTYTGPYLLRYCISFGIMAAAMIAAVMKTGGLKTSAFFVLLVLGCMIPFAALLDGVKAKKLCYAATNQRLIRLNESLFSSVYYDEIETCAFRSDPSGNTSLLCGKAVGSRPSSWRGTALFTGELEKDKEGKIVSYVLYAVDDPDGLKQVLKGRVQYQEV